MGTGDFNAIGPVAGACPVQDRCTPGLTDDGDIILGDNELFIRLPVAGAVVGPSRQLYIQLIGPGASSVYLVNGIMQRFPGAARNCRRLNRSRFEYSRRKYRGRWETKW